MCLLLLLLDVRLPLSGCRDIKLENIFIGDDGKVKLVGGEAGKGRAVRQMGRGGSLGMPHRCRCPAGVRQDTLLKPGGCRHSLQACAHVCRLPALPLVPCPRPLHLQGDFGLTMSMRQESAISPVGTVEYMAPEVGGWVGGQLVDE